MATVRRAVSFARQTTRGYARWGVYQGQKGKIPYAVINLQGRVFMASNDDLFAPPTNSCKKSKPK